VLVYDVFSTFLGSVKLAAGWFYTPISYRILANTHSHKHTVINTIINQLWVWS